MSGRLQATLRYYGISPWEIEVIYGILDSHFEVVQDEVEPDDPAFVSVLELHVPIPFSPAFFEWITFKKWERAKAIFKEMRRRRGSGHALRIDVRFAGDPGITFVTATNDKSLFENAMEKMDFVTELLPYHLAGLPQGTSELRYMFDPGTARWRQDSAVSDREYRFDGASWR